MLQSRRVVALAIALCVAAAASSVAAIPVAAEHSAATSFDGALDTRSVFILADSVALGARDALADRFANQKMTLTGFPGIGLDATRDLAASQRHLISDVAIVAVGYNIVDWDPTDFARQIDSVIEELVSAGAKHVIWVGLREPTMATSTPDRWTPIQLYIWREIWPQFNQLLEDALVRHPQLTIADWDDIAVDASYVKDAIHLSPKGYSAFAGLLKRSFVRAPLRIQPDTTVRVPVAGRGSVPADATAAWVRVHTVEPRLRARTFVHACDEPRGSSRSLTTRSEIGATTQLVTLDATGAVCVGASHETHFTLDVQGYVDGESATTTPGDVVFERILRAGEPTLVAAASAGEAGSAVLSVRARGIGRGGVVRFHRCGADARNGPPLAFHPTRAVTTVRVLPAGAPVCATAGADVRLQVTAATTVDNAAADRAPVTVFRGPLRPGVSPTPLSIAEQFDEPLAAGDGLLLSIRAKNAARIGTVTVAPCTSFSGTVSTAVLTPGRNSTALALVPASPGLCVHADAVASVTVDVVAAIPDGHLQPVPSLQFWDSRRSRQRVPLAG